MAKKIQYHKRERYIFIATDERDAYGNQIMKDECGKKHLLTGTEMRYENGTKVKCTVVGFGKKPVASITTRYLVLSEPRKVCERKKIPTITYSFSHTPPVVRGFSFVQGLGRHRAGRPFTCSCCGKSFPGKAGWRVDLRDIYFCNSCARKIYVEEERGNRHFIISTPMGNKR